MNQPAPYAAAAIVSEWGLDAVDGTLTCRQWVLRFESEQGHSIELPWKDLNVRSQGGEDDQVFFDHPQHPGVSLHTPSAEILREPVFAKRTALRTQINRFRKGRQRRRYFMATAGLFLFFFGLILIMVLGANILSRLVASGIPVSIEKEIGAKVLESMETEMGLQIQRTPSPGLTRLANRINTSQKEFGYELEVRRLNHPSPNAAALPGGMILVTSGMLESVGSREEIAGLLAHEIAHVRLRHGVRSVLASAGPFLLVRTVFGDRGGLLRALGEGSHILLHQSYSRKQEREADAKAFQYLLDARIDPSGLERVLGHLRSLDTDSGLGVLRSHPPTEERILHLKELREALPDMEFEKLEMP